MQHADNLLNYQSALISATVRYIVGLLLVVTLTACATSGQRSPNEERSFSSYIELATSYLQQGNTRSAENSLEQAADIDDEDPRLLHAYGLLYQLRKEPEDAEEMFLAALEKAPDYSQARNNYGVFLSSSDRDAEALVEFSKAAKDPDYPLRAISYENMAEVALKVNNLKLATESMQNAAQLAPTQKRYFLRAAHLFYLDKNYNNGQEYFNRYLIITDSEGVDPTSEALQVGFAIASARKDKPTEEYIKQRMNLLGPQVDNEDL